ncbi:MAG: Transcriptional regulator, XRE family [Microgenomates group bacterium GW2011_GWC1_43_11]|nr:MAG: Transcriptional regulator, XRE family [Microgenomates group bacterium GW2011_GWC1_43_11]
MKIFFAGPLTNLENPDKVKAFYIKLAALAKQLGHEPFWAFLSGTDPIKNPKVSAQEVYRRDTEQIAKSDLMIAYVGENSIGTGEEIEYAKSINLPVIIMYEKGDVVSRMLKGNPAVKKEIIFETEDDAVNQLTDYLSSLRHPQ